jgi:hypothetical protein
MQNKRYFESLSGGILLIGLGILFLVPGLGFWPWILVVVGAAQLPALLANNKGWYAWQGFFWLVGLAFLFSSGFFWPGILILVGISMLFGALSRESKGSPFGTRPLESPSQPTPSTEPGEASEEPFATKKPSDTKKLE